MRKYEVRCVAHSYKETFALAARYTNIRTIIANVAGWKLDIKTAFFMLSILNN